ncbi:MAG: RNA-binding protein [Candidatus Paracaedibacteraceae bacterium]|nr:RNA-binding protein [Candidatus Paracaedibacteraceae bacterium]
MNNKLYVSNLSFSMRDAELQEVFVNFGSVLSAKVVIDRFSGRSKGFGFVEMQTPEEAQKALIALNGTEVAGRVVRVMEANPKPEQQSAEMRAH